MSRFKRLSRRGQWWNHLESRPGCFTYLGLAFLSVLRSQSVQQERAVTRDGREAEHGGRAIRNRTVLRFGLPALSRGDSILLVPCVRTYVARPTIIKKYDDCRLLPFTVVRFCLVQGPSFPPSYLSTFFSPNSSHDSKRLNARFRTSNRYRRAWWGGSVSQSFDTSIPC